MRMKRAPRRRPTNISLPAELVDEAKKLDVNLSREVESFLSLLVKARRSDRWRSENEAAIRAYNAYVKEHGIWNEDDRGW